MDPILKYTVFNGQEKDSSTIVSYIAFVATVAKVQSLDNKQSLSWSRSCWIWTLFKEPWL